VATEIEFPDVEPRFVFDRGCLAFIARVGDTPVECLVTAELLMTHFGAQEPSEDALRAAYHEQRSEIQSIAKEHIQNGWVEEGQVVLTTRFTRLRVQYSVRIVERPTFLAMVDAAQKMLAEFIGANAGTVAILWDTETQPSDSPVLILEISYPPHSHPQLFRLFPGARWEEDPLKLRLTLGMNWARILRMQARKLAIQSG
jgi:hypothetical protein